ncbi:helix-turn-helix DNA binding domain [Arthrobacter phage Bumble]|uniref:Helix-turn-helix DNA binding domain protein n=1 Tax=Arthrobacter phage Bumble TaxID=2743904 RepID=A0A7G3V9S5_9CAUD|nr:helix-turn-helix DNA binding domain protein [Arthrobacter phage Bumble]
MPSREGSGRPRVDRDAVRALLEDCYEPRDIAARLGITERTVLRIRHELGFPVGPAPYRKRVGPEDLVLIETCLQEGFSFAEITKTHGYTYQTLARHFPGRGMSKEEGSALGLAVRQTNQLLRKQRIPALC